METVESLHRFMEHHQVIEAFALAEEYATAGVITTEYAKILGYKEISKSVALVPPRKIMDQISRDVAPEPL